MRPPLLSIIALAVSCGLSLCACAHGPVETIAKEPVNMAPHESAPVANSAPIAEEMANRFLKLIDEIKSGSEITVERVQEVMQVKLEPTDRGNSEAFGDLSGGYKYTVVFDPKNGAGIEFTDSSSSPACPLPITFLLRSVPRFESSVPLIVSNGFRTGWMYGRDDGSFLEVGIRMTSTGAPIEQDYVCSLGVRPAA